MGRWVGGLLLLVVLAANAATASGATTRPPRLYITDHAVGPVLTDGERWAAYRRSATEVRVLDTLRRSSFSVQLRPECDLKDIGVSELLIGCDAGRDPQATLVNLFTQVPHSPLGLEPAPSYFDATRVVRDVGRYWIRGYDVFQSFDSSFFFNWRTGQNGYPYVPYKGASIPDLDSPGLAVPLCWPLQERHTEHATRIAPGFVSYDYRRPLAAGVIGSNPQVLLLDRCGVRPVGRFPCSSTCGEIELGGGALTWMDRPATGALSRARAYLLGTHRAFTFTASRDAQIAHTRRRLFVSSPTGGSVDSYGRNFGQWILRSGAWIT
jgi:hypothetical protein